MIYPEARCAYVLQTTTNAELEIVYVHQFKREIKYSKSGNFISEIMPFPSFMEEKMKQLMKMNKDNHIETDCSIFEGDNLNEKIIEMIQKKEVDLIMAGISKESEIFRRNNLADLIEKKYYICFKKS